MRPVQSQTVAVWRTEPISDDRLDSTVALGHLLQNLQSRRFVPFFGDMHLALVVHAAPQTAQATDDPGDHAQAEPRAAELYEHFVQVPTPVP